MSSAPRRHGDPGQRATGLVRPALRHLVATLVLAALAAAQAALSPSLSAWQWTANSLVCGIVIVGSAAIAITPGGEPGRLDRLRCSLVLAIFLLGLGQTLTRPGPSGFQGDLIVATGLHVAGLSVLILVAAAFARAPHGANRGGGVSVLVDTAGALVVVALVATTAVATANSHGGADLRPAPMVTLSMAGVLVAVVVAVGSAVRPGVRHPLPSLLVAGGGLWVSDLLVAAAPAAIEPAISSGLQLVVLPVLAWSALWVTPASAGSPGELPDPVYDRRSTALPLLGAATAVTAFVAVDPSLLPSYADQVLAALAAVCLLATGWRVHHVLSATSGRVQEPGQPHRDSLTGLHDRRAMRTHLDAAGPTTLLAIDLEGFRRINEEAGHDIGDQVLIQVAFQLSMLSTPGGLAARIDGDDFALAIPGADTDAAWDLANDVQRTLRQPFDVGGRRFHLSANVCIVLGHDPLPHQVESRADILLRCADVALSLAQSSANGIAVHDDEACRTTPEDPLLEIVAELHAALASDDQLVLHFQPQHRLDTDGPLSAATLSGCEALIRWQHPTRGLVGPATILRAARSGHLGRPLTDRVIELAVAAASTWWSTQSRPVAINLTTEDLDDDGLPYRIAAVLARNGVPAAALTVEVVEDSLMLDPERAVRTLTSLRAIGLRVAIDDYGTGYSSLAYLHRLPIDEVKFDRSLTSGIADDAAATAIVRHSVRLAHELGLVVLAEGIERPQDLVRLRELGCDAVQGYYTGRPMPLTQWVALLSGERTWDSAQSAPTSVAAAARRPDVRPYGETQCGPTESASVGRIIR